MKGAPLAIIDAAPAVGPRQQALDELWQRASKRLWSQGHILNSFRLRRRFSLTFLRVGQLKLIMPLGQVPDCENCVDVCCTGPNSIVSLRLRDIASLEDAGLAQYITPRIIDDKNQNVFHAVFPILKRDHTGTCMLLDDNRMCGAYPSWPLSCARYPYALDVQNRVVFYAKGCKSTQTVNVSEAPMKMRNLVRAVVDSYNERIKDAILLTVARKELEGLGLLEHLQMARWPLT